MDKYIWKKIDKKWGKFLLSNNFYIKDCPPDGNCQFRSIENVLQSLSHIELRSLVSDYILKLNDEEFKIILSDYIIEKKSGQFYGNWNPSKIKTKKQLAHEINKLGFNFEGDNITLSILSKVLNVEIIIMNEPNSIIRIGENKRLFIILNFIKMGNTGHYISVGYKFNNNIYTIFDKNNINYELRSLINRKLLLYRHIIYSVYEKGLDLEEYLSSIQKILGKFSNEDIYIINKIIEKITI